MKPKLVVLNLLLAAAVVVAAWQARVKWREAQTVRRATLSVPARPPAPPPVPGAPRPETAMATHYADVANKDLFASDRNPNIVVPPPVVEKPKPMPPLPVFFGAMELPSGTKAIMAEKSGAAAKTVRIGDRIGEFTVLALDRRKVTFDWDGKKIDRNLDDLIDRSGNPGPGGPAAAPANNAGGPAAAPGAAAAAQGPISKPCGADTSPNGTVVDGYKKVQLTTIFGTTCNFIRQ